MKKKDVINKILKEYNEYKKELKHYIEILPDDLDKQQYWQGKLSAIRWVLVEVYDFKPNDKRF